MEKIELKIGEIRMIKGIKVQCVKYDFPLCYPDCALFAKDCTGIACAWDQRDDKQNVVFKKIE